MLLLRPDVLTRSDQVKAGQEVTCDNFFLLQELFTALLGITGDVFVDASASRHADQLQHPGSCCIKMATDITWIDSTDRAICDQLARLGFHYQQLQVFVQQEQWRRAEPGDQPGAYRQAVAGGVQEVLRLYEETVLEVEQHMEEDPGGGLPELQYHLAEMQVLLPELHQLVWDIMHPDEADAPPLSGAELLRALAAAASNGQPLLHGCFQRLLWHGRQVLFKQLTQWMVHGVLADEGAEFFIQPAFSLPPLRPDGNPWTDEERTYHDWHQAFEINNTKFPPGVNQKLAEDIEFVGRAVRLLRAPPADALLKKRPIPPPSAAAPATGCQRGRLDSTGGGWGQPQPAAAAVAAALMQAGRPHGGDVSGASMPAWEQQAVLHRQGLVVHPLLPYEDTLEFAKALAMLQEQQLPNPVALERTVEAIRADVAGRLWQLLVVQAGLMQHLAAMKDYLLLARGDFWNCFLADAWKAMALPPLPNRAAADIAVPFQRAALKSSAQDDPLFKLFKLHLSKNPLEVTSAVGGLNYVEVPAFDAGWDNLWLEAQLPWPLNLVLTHKQLDRYNALFQFLLRLKRVQMHLEAAWQELGRMCGRGGSTTREADIAPLLQLRQHMAHLVSNLQIYLQQDVIETNYTMLEEKVAAAQDFSEAEKAHERFLHTLMTQSFLSHSSLCRQFGEVFQQVRQLCGVVARAAHRPVEWDQVQAIAEAFNSTISSLYVSLQSKTLQQYDKAPHLRQLYLRLDFNGYISKRRMNYFAAFKTQLGQQRQQHIPAVGFRQLGS